MIIFLNRLIGLFLVFNCFLMRPAALGQSLTGFSIVISVVLIVFYSLLNKLSFKVNLSLKKQMNCLVGLLLIYWIYSLGISIYFGRVNYDHLIKELVTTIVIVPCYILFLTNANNNKKFFSDLNSLLSFLGYSALITFLISLSFGIESAYMFSLDVRGYESVEDSFSESGGLVNTGAVYFPLSMIYGRFASGDLELVRISGFFREAGIYQAFCCFGIAAEFFGRKSKIVFFGLLMGVIFTFSSAGLAMLFVVSFGIFILYKKISPARMIAALSASVFLVPLVLYMPYIGLNDKSDTHSTSITDRTEAVEDSLQAVQENIFGYGIGSNPKDNSGINMIALLGSIGVFGFLLQFIIISGFRFNFSYSEAGKILCCSPLLLTAIFSQPLVGAPFIYIAVMLFISDFRS